MSARFVEAAALDARAVRDVLATSFGPHGRDHLVVSATNQLKVTKSGRAALDGLFPSKNLVPHTLRPLLLDLEALEREAGDGTSAAGIMAAAALAEMVDLRLSDAGCVRLARAFRNLRASKAWRGIIRAAMAMSRVAAEPAEVLAVEQVAASALQGQFPPRQEQLLVRALVVWITGASEAHGLCAAAAYAAAASDRLLIPCVGHGDPRVLGRDAFALGRPPMYRVAAQQGSAQTQHVRDPRFMVWTCPVAAIESRDNAAVYVDSAQALEDAVAFSAARTVSYLEILRARLGVNVLVCTQLLHQVALDACERLGILAVQSVSPSEARELCGVAGIDAVVDTGLFALLGDASDGALRRLSRFVGRAAEAGEARLGTTTCVLIEGVEHPVDSRGDGPACGQILVYGGSLGLAKEFAASLARAAQLVALWARERAAVPRDGQPVAGVTGRTITADAAGSDGFVAVGGAWELALARALASAQPLADSFEAKAAIRVLQAAARAVPLALVPFDARQALDLALRRLEITEGDAASVRISLDAGTRWRLVTLAQDAAPGAREPLALKMRQLERLMDLLEQMLRIDAIVPLR